MNRYIHEQICAFAREMSYALPEKTDTYHCIDDLMQSRQSRLCVQMFYACRKDRTGARDAVSLFLSGIQLILPHEYHTTGGVRKIEDFSAQIQRLSGICSDRNVRFCLRYIENARNDLVHIGLIQSSNAPADLFRNCRNDDDCWWYLLNCILHTVISCHALFYPVPRFKGLSIFRYNWKKVFSGNYSKVRNLGVSDGYFGLVTQFLSRISGLVILTVYLGIIMTVTAGAAGILREIKNAIFEDNPAFHQLTAQDVSALVSELSKAERARFMSKRMEILRDCGNNYKVGDTVRCHEDMVTKALYEMAVEEGLPNASTRHIGGLLTELTYNLSHVPVLKWITQIPSRHRYMVHDPSSHKVSEISRNDDLIRSYYSLRVDSSTSEIKAFAKALQGKAVAEYLIIGNDPGAVSNIKAALTGAGVPSRRIRTTYGKPGSEKAQLKVRILR